MKEKRVIVIDSLGEEVREEFSRCSLEDLQGFVGGLIERVPLGKPWHPNTTLYVDEEGICKGLAYGFLIEGSESQLCGCGVIIGAVGQKISVEEVRKRVRFW